MVKVNFTSDEAHKNVQASLDSVTSDPKTGVAGISFAAVNRNGDIITANASGKKALTGDEPMTLSTVFWIASCTKMIATIAVMQLVEQGKLDLDDHKQLYKLCPELEKVQVLEEGGKLVDKEKDITLRMLLSHTAGFGYEFFNPKLRDYGRPMGFDVFSGDIEEIMRMPLVNQPGSRWEYGINIDWAGIALERFTGMSLNEYMQEYIFKPLEMESTNMFPTQDMRKELATVVQRWKDGSFEDRDHPYRRSLIYDKVWDQGKIHNSGGGGLFSRPLDYVQVLAALLNGGTSPKTKKQILKPETVKAMLENQVPEFPDFARQGTPAAKVDLTNSLPEIYPQEGNPPQGWCLSAFVTIEPGVTGRGRNTAWWAGIANLFWWVDVEKGVAGMIASQILPFGDPHVMGQWFACEKIVYDAVAHDRRDSGNTRDEKALPIRESGKV